MKLNENSIKYREKLRQREDEYEDYARNGGCVALAFAAILIITGLLATIIFAISNV